MLGSHPVRRVVALLCSALFVFGCASTDTSQGATGSLSLELVLAGGIEIDVVDWEITGNGMEMGGSVDVSAPGSTASVEVFGLPVGEDPYLVELSAMVEGEVTCSGSAEFDIEVGMTTEVHVMVQCKRVNDLGGVRVDGKFNICAELTKVVVSPLQTSVGNDIDLFSAAADEEGDPIAYMWTSGSGSIADPMAASTVYTCTEAGGDDITILVTDDDGNYCMSMWTVAVNCVDGQGDLCMDVVCDDDGNECTDVACNPANGQCETSNNTNECDGGNGICSEGQCVPNDLCMDVTCEDDGNECTDEACNPSNGECETSNNTNTCDGGNGVCSAGQCVPSDLCMDVVCEDDGNECTDVACNPANGQCETTNNTNECDGGNGTCSAGVCEPNDLCAGVVCEDDDNECTEVACNAANGQCETTNLDGNQCGGGGGLVELVTNGGFETGALNIDDNPANGWTLFCAATNGTCVATMDEAESGLWSANLFVEGGVGDAVIKNANIGIGTVTPGATVTVSFDLLGSAADGGVVFVELFSELSGGGVSKSELLGGALFPGATWTNYSFTTTLGDDVSGGISLQLKSSCGAAPTCLANAYFDNASVTIETGNGEAGICSGGECLPEPECVVNTDCPDTGNECTDAVCNAGTCGTSDNTNTCDGGNGTCSAGVCEPTVEALYTQDFESLDQASPDALGNDGWLIFGNVFSPDGLTYLGGYGVFSAPNNTGGFCGIALGQGGPTQGEQQLVIISDYNNSVEQTAGNRVQALTFQERTIGAGDVGKTLTFSFDAKRGNINDPGDAACPCNSTADASIKTLDPGAGFAQTNFVPIDTTALPTDWARYSVSLPIGAGLVGQLLQVGFSATASNFEPSGVFYDNIVVTLE